MGERIILQTTTPLVNAISHSGTLEGWQDGVARLAIGNSRLVLAISTAFAGPLLYPTGSESGGFHFRGASSTGKSTALIVGGSVWGGGGINGYCQTWRATSNGLEGIAAAHCDTLLCLDEMGQVDGREAGAIAYMLANGQGKSRANRHGGGRKATEWRLLFLSSGELGLSEKMSEDGRGRRAVAGQNVRIVEIPADPGAGFGLFEDLHGFRGGSEFSTALKRAAAEHYGHAARHFVRHLVDTFDTIAPTVRSHVEAFVAQYCPSEADGQVKRVASRFGLVAAGGEMATAFKLVPWSNGEATGATARCFRDWLRMRGGIKPAEETDALAAVRRFIELHGSSRFEAMGDLAPRTGLGEPVDQRVTNRAGFRRRGTGGELEFIILPEAWKGEVCAGLDPTMVAKTLRERGVLVEGGAGRLQNSQRLPGFPTPVRCYVVRGAVMGEPEPRPEPVQPEVPRF